jgi:predicted dinucleotide-binding enzyme
VGSDAGAKQTMGELITRLGYAPVDLGCVEQGRLVQFPGGPPTLVKLGWRLR